MHIQRHIADIYQIVEQIQKPKATKIKPRLKIRRTLNQKSQNTQRWDNQRLKKSVSVNEWSSMKDFKASYLIIPRSHIGCSLSDSMSERRSSNFLQ